MNTIIDWEHFVVYLSGAIDFDENRGYSWRDEWTRELIEIGIEKEQIYNPCRKPIKGAKFNLDDEARLIKEHRDKKDWEALDKLMQQIIRVDLRLCDKSDIILVNFPKIGNDKFVHKILDQYDEVGGHKSSLRMNDLFWQVLEKYKNMKIPTYGTIHEIVIARLQRKPVFIVWEDDGLESCSAWLSRLVGYKNVFANFQDLKKRIVELKTGTESYDAGNWLLIS